MVNVDRLSFPDISYKNTHGIVLRSSGIFYYKKNHDFKTTLSMLNYWKIKRDIDVTIICSLRKLDGSLILREKISFNNSEVINYVPSITESNFEGSLEVEIFSLKDMVIPYAGVAIIYESKFGISMTHTYGRTYSMHEIEEGNIMSKGEETCCHSLLPKNKGKSYSIFHNGAYSTPSQEVVLSLLNYLGERITTKFKLISLNPYETIKIDPRDYFENYDKFLCNNPGNVSIHFTVNNTAFPRMLTINETLDGDDFQVNHSNFNLSKTIGPKLQDDGYGYMNPICFNNTETELIIYPDCEDGEYEAIYKNEHKISFNKNRLVSIKMDSSTNNFVKFRKINDKLPLRIHTGIKISKSIDRLPSETCLGIWHTQCAPKKFSWLTVAANKKVHSRIVLRPFTDEIRLNEDPTIPVSLKLYSEKNSEIKETSIDPSELINGKELKSIFPDVEVFLDNSYGWLTIFSKYPYSEAYGTLENNYGSISYEHSF